MTRGALGVVAIAICAVGCGRVGFDSVGDAGASSGDGGSGSNDGGVASVFTQVTLPGGGSFNELAIDGDGARYAIGYFTEVFRSTDGMTWTPCGELAADGISIDAAGTIYVAGAADVYASVDHCASWQPTHLAQAALSVDAVDGQLYAGTQTGLAVYSANVWTLVSTPLDGQSVSYVAAGSSGANVVEGNGYGGGLAQRPGAGSAWQMSTGTTTGVINALAIAPSDATRGYAFEGALDSNTGDILESIDGGATWNSVDAPGGYGLAIDPANPDHVLAAIYNDLVSTSNAFDTTTTGLRGVIAPAEVLGLLFEPSGGVLAATESGIYESSNSTTFDWQPRSSGLDAWQISGIAATSTDIYLATEGGILHAVGGGAYALETNGLTNDLAIERILAIDDGANVFTTGAAVNMSTDGGATWPAIYEPAGPDEYFTGPITSNGSRVYIGTGTRLIYADSPYTSWTPATIAGDDNPGIEALLVVDGQMWAACDTGLFAAPIGTLAFTQLPALPIDLTSLASLADGSIVVGADSGVWISDASATTFTQVRAGAVVFGVTVSGTTVIASASDGVHVSHDRGVTWLDVPGLDTRVPLTSVIDPATGDLLVGTAGTGLWRTPAP